ncbi:MAG: hypothetical protein FJ261_16260 [Planctomycetes bacterium]|nr:hypothetical protein [Planctomycetota bacterium]
MDQLVPYTTVAELAARLNITKQAVWGLVRRGVITPPIRFSTRHHVWHADTAEQIVRSRESTRQEVKHTKAARLRARLARDRAALDALESAGGA